MKAGSAIAQPVAHESERHRQPVGRDAVARAFHDMSVEVLPACVLQRFGGGGQALNGHDLILIAMDQKDRRAGDNFIGQKLGFEQAAREAFKLPSALFIALPTSKSRR